jgi:RimJ/RimL family protein N-acetyltransferase
MQPVLSAGPLVARAQDAIRSEWRRSLPVLTGAGVRLRELRLSDAATLLELLTVEDVTRFISPPPTTVEGFERFILWTQRERAAGNYVCFGIVPEGYDQAVGIFQVRQIEPAFAVAEWGFALGMPHWGSGVFPESARLVVDFAVDVIGVRRLEARAASKNGRGNGALKKIGAVCEGLLRKSFLRDGEYLDQNLWIIDATEWRRLRLPPGASVN